MFPFFEFLQKTWKSRIKEKEMYHLEYNNECEHQLTLTLSPRGVMQRGTDGSCLWPAFITPELRKCKTFIWGINKSTLCSGGRYYLQDCSLPKHPWTEQKGNSVSSQKICRISKHPWSFVSRKNSIVFSEVLISKGECWAIRFSYLKNKSVINSKYKINSHKCIWIKVNYFMYSYKEEKIACPQWSGT